MKLRRIRKNLLYMRMYGASAKRCKKAVRSSPDGNIKRIPARKLKSMLVKLDSIMRLPLGGEKYIKLNSFRFHG